MQTCSHTLLTFFHGTPIHKLAHLHLEIPVSTCQTFKVLEGRCMLWCIIYLSIALNSDNKPQAYVKIAQIFGSDFLSNSALKPVVVKKLLEVLQTVQARSDSSSLSLHH